MDWLSAVIGAFVGALFTWLTQKRQMQHRVRQTHLQAIKEDVINPLLNQLEYYYSPLIINDNCKNVIRKTRNRIIDVPTSQWNQILEITLSVFDIGDLQDEWAENDVIRDLQGLQEIERPRLEPDERLYADMKACHASTLMNSWELFESMVKEYNARCLDYVITLKRQLTDLTDLPVWSAYEQKPGMDAAGLAIFIWQRQSGAGTDVLRLEDLGGWTRLMLGSTIVAQSIGNEQEIKHCLEVVEKSLANKTKAIELLNLKSEMKIEESANVLVVNLKDFMLSNKIRGNCTYIKV